jgi:hypothetical protein
MQELVARGRVLFKSAPKRFQIYKLVDGRKSTPEIAYKAGCAITNTQNDLKLLRDAELARVKKSPQGKIVKKEKFAVYEKTPLANIIPFTYFLNPIKAQKDLARDEDAKGHFTSSKEKIVKGLQIPSEGQLISIFKMGESQIYEFKQAGVEVKKITKGIAAFANTKQGGLIFYGVEDDGAIIGSDQTRDKFSAAIQQSVKDSLTPSLVVKVIEKDILGHVIQLIYIPPRLKKTVYQYLPDERYYIRKDTIICSLRPDELKLLHSGKSIV